MAHADTPPFGMGPPCCFRFAQETQHLRRVWSQVGDRLVEVDGRNVSSRPVQDLAKLFAGPPGTVRFPLSFLWQTHRILNVAPRKG